jgi:hypothetical protein
VREWCEENENLGLKDVIMCEGLGRDVGMCEGFVREGF